MTLHALDRMIGATLLVRVTYLKPDDSVGHVAEFAGVVTSVDPLVTIERGGDEPFTLAPDPDAFEVGSPASTTFARRARSLSTRTTGRSGLSTNLNGSSAQLPISRTPQGVCDCESECAELPISRSVFCASPSPLRWRAGAGTRRFLTRRLTTPAPHGGASYQTPWRGADDGNGCSSVADPPSSLKLRTDCGLPADTCTYQGERPLFTT